MANNPTFYVDRGTVYKCKRGMLKSSFVSEMLIKHRSPLTLYQNLLAIFPYTLDAKNIFELGRWIVNLPEIHLNAVIYLDNLHANTCRFSKRCHQVTLFCIIRMTSRNTISVYVLSPLFHLGGGRVRLHVGRRCNEVYFFQTHHVIVHVGCKKIVKCAEHFVTLCKYFLLASFYSRTPPTRRKSTTSFQSFTIRLLEVSVNSN